MAGGSAPRYAPADPSVPPPWKALVDGNTGYIYYWNTETNVTQYEKPLPSSALPPPPPVPPPAPSLSDSGPKQAILPVVSSPDDRAGKRSDRRASANPGVPPDATRNNPAMVESMHLMVSPQHTSGKFISGGGHTYENASNQHLPHHISEQHGSRHVAGHHGRYISEHNSRSTLDHHISDNTRTMPELHGGEISDHHTRSMPDRHSEHMADHHSRSVQDHHGGHTSDHLSRPMSEHQGGVSVHGIPRSAGQAPSGGVSRSSGYAMPGGGMHVNSSDSSWGGSSGRPIGSLKGVSSTRTNQDGGGAWSMPKPAALPRQQGDKGRMLHSDQHRYSGSSSLGGSSLPTTPIGPLKRAASDYPSGAPDVQKRPRLQVVSEPDAQTYKMQHEITVMGESVPPPFMTFDMGNFPPEIYRELRSAGFTAPTPIQAQSWPIALQKRDIVAIAKTGSGKTLGYLLPAFLHVMRIRANSRAGPIVLVLAPTRELATQIQDEAAKFGRSSRITSTCVYGGAPKGPQLRDLERGADIVIATPGRLNDFLEVKKISLRQVSYLVLDEADRMLDMGFELQIRKIVKDVPSRRQMLMFTATWPREVRKIAADLLVDFVQVNIGNSDELIANKAITQYVEVVQPLLKQRRLEEILRSQQPGSKIIIFCSTKKMCDQLARNLSRGFGAVAIHGDKSQMERDHVLGQFKAGRSPVLVATDVAARGLDIKDIRVVINYDFPTGVEDYVHRIGRTGRAGATGEAFTFFSEQDSKYARELIKILENAEQRVPLELRQLAGRGGQSRGRGRWHTSTADELVDDRGSFNRDGSFQGGGFGHRDRSVAVEGAGRWGFMDERIGIKDGGGIRGGRVGDNRVGQIGRLTSRVENTGNRSGGVGSKSDVPTNRDGNGARDTRRDDVLGSRDGGFRSTEGGSGGNMWGQNDKLIGVRPGASEQAEERRREMWGEGGPGGRGSFGSSDQRGRIFNRLGERSRFSDKSLHKDVPLDGKIHDSRKFFGNAREETRRNTGSYSRSPSKGWQGSRSPGKVRTKSTSQSPTKGWGSSRSRSRSPSRGWGGNQSPSQREGNHSRGPSHSRRTGDCHEWSGSSLLGLRSRSTNSPKSLHSPKRQGTSYSQLRQQDIEHGNVSKKYRNMEEPVLSGGGGRRVLQEKKEAHELVLSASENVLKDQLVSAPSVMVKHVFSPNSSPTILLEAESKDKDVLPADEVTTISDLKAYIDDLRSVELIPPEEATKSLAVDLPSKNHRLPSPSKEVDNQPLIDDSAMAHEPLPLDKSNRMIRSSKLESPKDGSCVVISVHEQLPVDQSSRMTKSIKLDSPKDGIILAPESRASELHATDRIHTPGNHFSDSGFKGRAPECSENYANDPVVSSPEEGMVI